MASRKVNRQRFEQGSSSTSATGYTPRVKRLRPLIDPGASKTRSKLLPPRGKEHFNSDIYGSPDDSKDIGHDDDDDDNDDDDDDKLRIKSLQEKFNKPPYIDHNSEERENNSQSSAESDSESENNEDLENDNLIEHKSLEDDKDLFIFNNRLQFSLKRTSFKNPKKYMGEHHYEIRLINHGEVNNLTEHELIYALNKILLLCVKRLREKYSEKFFQSIFIVISTSDMDSGIHTGHFDLDSDPEELVQECLAKLYSFLQSSKKMDLESFKIQIRVVSLRHKKDRDLNNETPNEQEDMVGLKHIKLSKNVLIRPTRENCYQLPEGYGDNPAAFKNKCLLGAAIYSYYKEQSKHALLFPDSPSARENSKIFEGIKNCNTPSKPTHAERLYELIKIFVQIPILLLKDLILTIRLAPSFQIIFLAK